MSDYIDDIEDDEDYEDDEDELPESGTYLEAFNPYIIPMQAELMDLINNWDYSKSTPEILLSGSYGSSKSIIMAHIAIVHCFNYPGARVFLGRRALPDLKKTIFNEILEHLQSPSIREGQDYSVAHSTAEIHFSNGSSIISGSWADRRYMKFRSLKISGFIFEEAAENDERDKEAFMTIKARLRRIPSVPQNFLIAATNPGSPEHWLYDYFINGSKEIESRRVLYSVTSDNPFLDPVYIQQLKADLPHKEALRYLYGQWISINEEVVYSEYDPDQNFIQKDYTIKPEHPIILTFDFNIGFNKPMSALLLQYDQANDEFHAFAESVIQSARTQDVMNDLEERGLLMPNYLYMITGDAAGSHRDTRSKRTDYQVIYDHLQDIGINFIRKVAPSNPPIRKRHNIVNAYLKNSLGQRRLFVYKNCKTLDKGLKLTKLKEGSNYIEDDSYPYQHITTALGYAICMIKKMDGKKSSSRSL